MVQAHVSVFDTCELHVCVHVALFWLLAEQGCHGPAWPWKLVPAEGSRQAAPQLVPDGPVALLLHPALLGRVRYTCHLWYFGCCGPVADKCCPVPGLPQQLLRGGCLQPWMSSGWLSPLWDRTCPFILQGAWWWPSCSQICCSPAWVCPQ